MYAILDIESTGGRFSEEAITEIAIIRYDGHKETDRFSSLINPQRPIDPFVSQLTGIKDQSVKRAPRFHELAKRIIEITEGCLLVAHNASYDYRMLRQEFARLGYVYQKNTVCTVILAKKLIPGLPSYSLGKLSKSLGIPLHNRHRALGDTLATLELFKILLEKDYDKEIVRSADKPINILTEEEKKLRIILDTLPTYDGIFFLHDAVGHVIYIGRSSNIYKELNNMFSLSSKNMNEIKTLLNHVSWEEAGSDFIAVLRQSELISKLRPRFNRKPRIRKGYIVSSRIFPKDKTTLIIDKGRSVGERSVIMIENGELLGYAFFKLNYQVEKPEVLKKLLTPLTHSEDNLLILQRLIKRKRPEKIVHF